MGDGEKIDDESLWTEFCCCLNVYSGSDLKISLLSNNAVEYIHLFEMLKIK